MTENLLGITVHTFTLDSLNATVFNSIITNKKILISHHNLHSLYLFYKYEKMKEFYKLAKYVHIDGMSLIFLGKAFGNSLSRENRITYVDWIQPLVKMAAANDWKIFYLGSKPGVAQKAANILKCKYTSLNIKTMNGYFDVSSEENEYVIQTINEFKPDLLFVGMGMPRQEFWITDNYDHINAKVILSSGACFDYLAGEIDTPPRIMGKIGLEWIYRLFKEPKRLWRRYLIEPIHLVYLLLKHRL